MIPGRGGSDVGGLTEVRLTGHDPNLCFAANALLLLLGLCVPYAVCPLRVAFGRALPLHPCPPAHRPCGRWRPAATAAVHPLPVPFPHPPGWPVALMEGMAVAKTVALGQPTKPDYTAVASAVFSHPEIATVVSGVWVWAAGGGAKQAWTVSTTSRPRQVQVQKTHYELLPPGQPAPTRPTRHHQGQPSRLKVGSGT